MTMASLTASLLARKGHAQPSASARDIFAPDMPAEKRWQSPVKKKPGAHDPSTASQKKTEAANEQICTAPEKAAGQTPPRPLFAPVEARHTQTAQTGEVVRVQQPARKPQTADARRHKSLRLDEDADMQLRLLAARQGTTQQALMEKAVKELLKTETYGSSCICGSRK